MTVDIDKVFTAVPMSTWGFLSYTGQGCYIPAYQRPYSWDQSNAERLLEDALNGLTQLLRRKDAVSFLGTIIAIHDKKLVTVKPLYKREVAPRVMTIIDGQQRICTLAILGVIFHDLLRRELIGIQKQDQDQFDRLAELCQIELKQIYKIFALDMDVEGANLEPIYPRIIRFHDDAWSKRKGEYQYSSPVARLLWEYIQHVKEDNTKEFVFDPKDEEGARLDDFAPIVSVFKHLRRELKKVCGWTRSRSKSEDDDQGFPPLQELLTSDAFANALWGYELAPPIKKFALEGSDDKRYEKFVSVLRTLFLCRYINHRAAFTVVTTESEDDAFDMFEALNTTGEPLTAFETFKPRVIDAEGLEHYEMSPSKRSVDAIEGALGRYKGASARHDATTDLLLPFALATAGEKISKKLNDQRRFLRDSYDRLQTLDDQRQFISKMAQMATFLSESWNISSGEDPHFPKAPDLGADAIVAFQFLRHLNHTIAIAPMFQFYQRVFESDEASIPEVAREFRDAVLATAAFSALWRAVKGGANNIDARFREIMKSGNAEPLIPPLADRTEKASGVVSLENYKRMLRRALEREEIEEKTKWLEKASRAPLGEHSKVARFILTAAFDDTVIDENEKPLLKRGRKGILPSLTKEAWRNPSELTIEHIAPQRMDEEWRKTVGDDPDTIQLPGNLTLLPSRENSVFADRSWLHKHLFYRMVAATSVDQQNQIVQEAKKVGCNLSATATELFETGMYQGQCAPLAAFNGSWTAEVIRSRSRNICELAWDRIGPWLFN